MEYEIKEKTIGEIIELIEDDKINLNPSYQRNFIWSPKDQQMLLDSILKGYPLPNFFIYRKPDGKYEMVDGQQRSKTIFRFYKGKLTSSSETNKKTFLTIDKRLFLDYKLPIVIIKNLKHGESMSEFYVLINKKGKHLNIPEVQKSEFHDKNFMKLANACLSHQKFINLDLFTTASRTRMNDREYVQELLGFLKEGIKDKKKYIEEVFKNDINDSEYVELFNQFKLIIDKIDKLNELFPIKNTRYKQKNDFYTLFSFISENEKEELEILKYQYEILLLLNRQDNDGLQFIRPTNENCNPLKDYATNCVSQSNSKKARQWRLDFFNSILKNKSIDLNGVLNDVMRYLSSVYGPESIKTITKGDYCLIDINYLK
jgi:uncharacterized protein with ParB-like and HNH nuclease domain